MVRWVHSTRHGIEPRAVRLRISPLALFLLSEWELYWLVFQMRG